MRIEACQVCTDSCCFELDVFSLLLLMKKNHLHLQKARGEEQQALREGMSPFYKMECSLQNLKTGVEESSGTSICLVHEQQLVCPLSCSSRAGFMGSSSPPFFVSPPSPGVAKNDSSRFRFHQGGVQGHFPKLTMTASNGFYLLQKS